MAETVRAVASRHRTGIVAGGSREDALPKKMGYVAASGTNDDWTTSQSKVPVILAIRQWRDQHFVPFTAVGPTDSSFLGRSDSWNVRMNDLRLSHDLWIDNSDPGRCDQGKNENQRFTSIRRNE